MSELIEGKLYVSKYRNMWHVQEFIGWDKMEAEYQILGEFYSEKLALEYRDFKNSQKEEEPTHE